MGSPSTASSSKIQEASSKAQRSPLIDAHRLLELTGLLIGVGGLLILLSLASYLPQDPSLNTTVAPGTLPHNWIGPAGAYLADGLLQFFGWVAYLLPVALLVVGGRLLLAKPFDAPRTKMVGAAMLLISLGALLELFPYTPAVHGALRGGGLLGFLVATGLTHIFNRLGASIVTATAFLASLFLVTRFSFGWSAQFLQTHSRRVLTPLQARWSAWQEARAAKAAARRKRQVEEQRAMGRRPVLLQKVVARKAQTGQTIAMPPAGVLAAAPPAKQESTEAPTPPAVVMMTKPTHTTAATAPKIVGRDTQGYNLHSVTL